MTDNFTPEKTNPAPKMSLEDWKAMKDQEKSDVFKLLDQTTLDLAEVPGCFLRYLDTQARMNSQPNPAVKASGAKLTRAISTGAM